jgi:Plasmid encoded RepA protein
MPAVKRSAPAGAAIEIGHSVRGFLRQLEIDCGGKEMAAFRRQMLALASTHMILGIPSEDGPKTIEAPPVETFNAWLVDEEGQSVAWPGVLELGERFLETLLEHAVPLDPASISALKSSALGLDLYAWLGHSAVPRADRSGRDAVTRGVHP